jgi:hypothetical protein
MFSALTKRKRQSKVSVGQRYQKRDAPLVVWEVISLFRGTDGMPYAAMLRVDDPTMQKTVAQAILERGLHYTLVSGR